MRSPSSGDGGDNGGSRPAECVEAGANGVLSWTAVCSTVRSRIEDGVLEPVPSRAIGGMDASGKAHRGII
eukprot:m.1639702 g.1639702  ORF g.1639702 m.1639702 type:complete len:70 (+) comp37456_c0_seq1:2035-2244(+)